MESVNEQQ